MLVVDLPKSSDIPQEEKILQKYRGELESVLSHDFLWTMTKLYEEAILSREELVNLKSLPKFTDQISLLTDFLIRKASSEKEMCHAIIKFLIQELVSARLAHIIAKDLGTF